jgi:hypothetical protein
VIAGLNIYLPNDDISKAMCYSQKIADPQGTISFSVLGVALILSVGGFIIVTSLVLDTIVGWLQKKYNIGEHARKNWISDEKLQLQRLVCLLLLVRMSAAKKTQADSIVPGARKCRHGHLGRPHCRCSNDNERR